MRTKLNRLSVMAIATAIALSAGSLHVARAEDKDKFEDPKYKNAVNLYQKGDYAGAQAEFEKLTNVDGVGELSRYYLALCLQQKKQYRAAQDQYMYLYQKARDKNVRYKAWQALRSLPQTAAKTGGAASTKTASAQDGPGADAWITPQEGYGRSGPAASSEVSVTIIPTSCGRRRR